MKLKEYLDIAKMPAFGLFITANPEEFIGFFNRDLKEMICDKMYSLSGICLDDNAVKIEDYYDYEINTIRLSYEKYDIGYDKYTIPYITLHPKDHPIKTIEEKEVNSNQEYINALLDKIAELNKLLVEKDNYIPPKTLLDTTDSKCTLYYARADIVDTIDDVDLKEHAKYFPMSVFDHHLVYPDWKYTVRLNTMFNIVSDIMWFKWNFDRDYIPKNGELTYVLVYDNIANIWDYFKFNLECPKYKEHLDFYFSTEKLVKKCAEWLNNKYKED